MSLTMPERVPEVATGPLTVPRAPKPPAVPGRGSAADPHPAGTSGSSASVPPIASPALPTGVPPQSQPSRSPVSQPQSRVCPPRSQPSRPGSAGPRSAGPGSARRGAGSTRLRAAPPGQPAQVGYRSSCPPPRDLVGRERGAVLLVANISREPVRGGRGPAGPVTAACTKQVDGPGCRPRWTPLAQATGSALGAARRSG